MQNKLDPELKLRLRQAEKSVYASDWPDWRGGILFFILFCIPAFGLSYGVLTLAGVVRVWLPSLALAFIVGICAGGAFAFRPVK